MALSSFLSRISFVYVLDGEMKRQTKRARVPIIQHNSVISFSARFWRFYRNKQTQNQLRMRYFVFISNNMRSQYKQNLFCSFCIKIINVYNEIPIVGIVSIHTRYNRLPSSQFINTKWHRNFWTVFKISFAQVVFFSFSPQSNKSIWTRLIFVRFTCSLLLSFHYVSWIPQAKMNVSLIWCHLVLTSHPTFKKAFFSSFQLCWACTDKAMGKKIVLKISLGKDPLLIDHFV